MFGNNPKRPPSKGDGKNLAVQEIFPTLQGEGPYTGWPAIFIRLGGCNLACTFCDTEFESYQTIALETILDTVYSFNPKGKTNLVVITGGEPLRQPIHPLCQALIHAGYKVQIETNGTLYQELPREVEIVCSPKPGKAGYSPIRPDLLKKINAFKFIISAEQALYQNIGDVGQGNIPVYVQPMDEYDPVRNSANLKHTVELSLHYGYRVSLQTHKILGVA
jgi:7-carboxy-7-deazaguanine synthase